MITGALRTGTLRNSVVPVFAAILLLSLTACNEEKAQAVLAAANSFKAEGTKAVAAYENLFVSSVQSFEVDTPTSIENAKKALEDHFKKQGMKPIDQKTVLALAGVRRGPGPADAVKAAYADTRQLLNAFADALTNLPNASYFVKDSTIACTTEVAARLAKKFADSGANLKKNPVPMRARLGQLSGMINNALKAGDGERLVVLLAQLNDVERRGSELNDAAMRQSLVAAEAGVQVVKATRGFQTLSVSDILVMLGKALDVVNDSNFFNTEELGSRLANLKNDMESDRYWQRILAVKLGEAGSDCAPVQTKS